MSEAFGSSNLDHIREQVITCLLPSCTPTHASWLNQVELFFPILERKLLRRGEFASTDELAERIIAFIKDYNRKVAPFRWTREGRPLKVP